MRWVLPLCFALAGVSRAHVVTCEDSDALARARQSVAEAAEIRFDAALAKANLTPVTLRRVTWEAEPGEHSAPGTTIERTIDGKPASVLVVDSRGLACGHEALVRKAALQLELVVRTPYAANTRHVLACRDEQPRPDRCAAPAASHRVGYVVPPDLRYVGTRDVSYAVDVLDVTSFAQADQPSESPPESALFPRP